MDTPKSGNMLYVNVNALRDFGTIRIALAGHCRVLFASGQLERRRNPQKGRRPNEELETVHRDSATQRGETCLAPLVPSNPAGAEFNIHSLLQSQEPLVPFRERRTLPK